MKDWEKRYIAAQEKSKEGLRANLSLAVWASEGFSLALANIISKQAISFAMEIAVHKNVLISKRHELLPLKGLSEAEAEEKVESAMTKALEMITAALEHATFTDDPDKSERNIIIRV